MQNDTFNIPELDTEPAENESLPEHKANNETEENMVDVLDNYDAQVIHMGNSNECSMVDSDNIGDNIFTINIPLNFTYPSFDYWKFSHGSNLKKNVEFFPWYI